MIAASYWGKFKTVSQMAMTLLLIADIPYRPFEILELVLIWLALALTVISLIDYMRKNIDVLKEGNR